MDSRGHYTDSGLSAQRLGEAALRLGDIERLPAARNRAGALVARRARRRRAAAPRPPPPRCRPDRRCRRAPRRTRRPARPARALGHAARQRLHAEVVAHEQPVEADGAADDLGRSPAPRCWPAAPHRWPRRQREPSWRPAGRHKRGTARSRCAPAPPRGAVTTGSSRWLSLVARPWPGMCLITGSTPPAMWPSATARPSADTCSRVGAIGAVADDVVAAGRRHVEHRRAVGVDAGGAQLRRRQLGGEPRRAAGLGGIVGIEPPVGGRGGQLAPVRRPEPPHAPALLVDEHEDVGADRARAQPRSAGAPAPGPPRCGQTG